MDHNYHGSLRSSNQPHPGALTGGFLNAVLHQVDQEQLLLDVFVYSPSRIKEENETD